MGFRTPLNTHCLDAMPIITWRCVFFTVLLHIKKTSEQKFPISIPGNGLKTLLEEVDLANLQPAWWQLYQKLLRLS